MQALELSNGELNVRAGRVRIGATLEEVRGILGGTEYQSDVRGPLTARFWRFKLRGETKSGDTYLIYLAEFEDDRLAFGSLLPHG